MRASALFFYASVLPLALSCSTAMHWQKPGGNESALAQDLAACGKQAQAMFGGTANLALPAATDPRFGPMGPSQADVRMQEAQVLDRCMRARGYSLVSP